VPDDPGSPSPRRALWVAAVLGLGLLAALVVAFWVPDRSGGKAAPAGLKPVLAPAAGAAGCSPGDARVLRVLQFNIHFGVNGAGELDLGTLASEIEAERPDVVSLNEVDQGTQRSRGTDEAEELATATGLHAVYGPNLPWQGGLFGNAILTRYPVVHSANHRLPVSYGLEARGLLSATLRVGGRTISFSSMHLTDGDEGRTSRTRQAEAVADLLNHAEKPTIVAGDLNSPPDDVPVRILRQYLLDAQEEGGTGNGETMPESSPQNRFDYVLYDNAFAVVPGSTRALPSASSDHRSVFTELALLPRRCTR
jgi:endonuclease/exonuclease/phosphatase family metal-dependent hydrolase